eukprot:GHUV01051756.1.p1 GENE.GHUV01051756.1~~GHUV01051756.1.p1  ORF type:complete len:102 (+),score=16.09 GHUV01051756.1:323-628(+)
MFLQCLATLPTVAAALSPALLIRHCKCVDNRDIHNQKQRQGPEPAMCQLRYTHEHAWRQLHQVYNITAVNSVFTLAVLQEQRSPAHRPPATNTTAAARLQS